jgi:hypothetical protein
MKTIEEGLEYWGLDYLGIEFSTDFTRFTV